jgi:pimeloyl-ACP methyl ester carboxylesterase
MDQRPGFVAAPYFIYYERLAPHAPDPRPPIVMLHGSAHTGVCYRLTPDGRPGWADRFVAAGRTCYVADWPGSGRSGYVPPEQIDYQFMVDGFVALITAIGQPVILLVHSMTGPVAWKLVEQVGDCILQVIGIAPGPPGNIAGEIEPRGRVLEEREGETVFEFGPVTFAIDHTRPYVNTPEYLERQGIGASRRFPRAHLDAWLAQQQVTSPRLLLQRLNWRNSQVHVADAAPFAGKPITIITGTHDTAHPRAADQAIVDFLNGLGARAELVWLGDLGVEGNGHMLMLEDNSDEIAELVLARLIA